MDVHGQRSHLNNSKHFTNTKTIQTFNWGHRHGLVDTVIFENDRPLDTRISISLAAYGAFRIHISYCCSLSGWLHCLRIRRCEHLGRGWSTSSGRYLSSLSSLASVQAVASEVAEVAAVAVVAVVSKMRALALV
jgi:hypothetical protein